MASPYLEGLYNTNWLTNPGTETRGGVTDQTTTSAGGGYGAEVYKKLGGMYGAPKYGGANPFSGDFTGDWSGALGNIGSNFAGPDGQWADSRNVYKGIYGGAAPSSLGGPGASSFLTGRGGKGISDYQTALGFDRTATENQYTADAGRAMKEAMIAENAKSRNFLSGGRDVERGGVVRGEAYGNIASNMGREMLGYDERSLAAARDAMGKDIYRDDWRMNQDIDNRRKQEMLAMTAAQSAADPSNELAYASALGGLGQYEQGLDIAGKNWLKGNWDQEQAWDPMIAGLQGNVVASTPWDTTTTGTTSESRPGQSAWDQMLGYGAIFGGSALGSMGGGGGGVTA